MNRSVLKCCNLVVSMLLVSFSLVGCGQKIQIELTPKHTRATHLFDSKDAHLLSAENYEKIEVGMTQDEVRAIFGTEWPTVNSPESEEEYELVWQSDDKTKEIVVKFRGDKSIEKSESGVLPKDAP